jgi:hypothetical protein
MKSGRGEKETRRRGDTGTRGSVREDSYDLDEALSLRKTSPCLRVTPSPRLSFSASSSSFILPPSSFLNSSDFRAPDVLV